MTLPAATLTACIVILIALAAPHVYSHLPSLPRRPRRYRGRHVAARRLVFALPVKVVAL